MKIKILLLTTFVLFFFIQIFSSQSVKADFCGASCWTDNNCQINEQTSVLDISNKKACMINPACDEQLILGSPTNYCSYIPSGRACHVDSCPNYIGQNGAPCQVSGGCWAGATSGGCEQVKQLGKWDANDPNGPRCVQCDQQNYHKEVMNCGDTSGIHLNLGSSCSNWVCAGAGGSYCDWAGDQKFDSACGADTACDEKAQGDSCASGGKVCSSTGTCDCPSGTTWDGTKCASPPCSATLSVSSSGSGTCTVSASVSATGCDGQTFAIKDSSGTTKCSGVILAGSGTCASWSISSDTSYSLYLSGSAIPSDTKTASCGEAYKVI